MISEGPLGALAYRIKFANDVGDRLGAVLDAFMATEHGNSFVWSEPSVPERFGTAMGAIASKPEPDAQQRSNISIWVHSHGVVHVGICEWTMNDCGDWEDDERSIAVDFDQREDADDVVAIVLGRIISGGTGFSNALSSYVETALAQGPELGNDPSPNAG